MKITEVSPRKDDYVDFDRYYDDDQLERREIDAGHLYIARLIVNKLCNGDYAADYMVKVTDVIACQNHRFEEVAGEKIVAVLFEPCTFDGAPLPLAGTYSPYVEDDGMLCSYNFDGASGKFIFEEHGYFLARDSDSEAFELPVIASGLPRSS